MIAAAAFSHFFSRSHSRDCSYIFSPIFILLSSSTTDIRSHCKEKDGERFRDPNVVSLGHSSNENNVRDTRATRSAVSPHLSLRQAMQTASLTHSTADKHCALASGVLSCELVAAQEILSL